MTAQSWLIHHNRHDLSRNGWIMGIVNVTPDSFSDGGRFINASKAVEHALALEKEGADVIDIGGESTRPGAVAVTSEEELARVLPVITELRSRTKALISIDTFKACVAEAAINAGADIINDITGLRGDPGMLRLAARTTAGLVVMHMQGQPRTMQQAPHYEDAAAEVESFFRERLTTLADAGIDPERVALDPGIGFGKRLEHNMTLINATRRFTALGRPLLMGVSRKSMLGQILGSKLMQDRNWPTIALTSYTRELGATIHRVHDVTANRHALRMTEAILFGMPS